MLDLSAVAKLEKNKISSTGVWIVLLEVHVSPEIEFKICNNNEDVEWPTGSGQIWTAFPFQLGTITEDSRGELPQLTLQVSNVTRTVQHYLEQSDGGVDSQVILRVVHSDHLDQTTPELEEVFSVQGVSTSAQWVDFRLGPDFTTSQRFPTYRFMKNFCPWRYGGIECGVSEGMKNTYPTCNKTLENCRERENAERFGGEPALPGGLYVR